MSDEVPQWQEMSAPEQVMALQMNVQRIGLLTTLKKAFKRELDIEDLLEVQ